MKHGHRRGATRSAIRPRPVNGTAAEEIELGTGPDSVPRARWAATAFATRVAPALVDDVALVVSELVTNAVLHADPPAWLRLIDRGQGAIRVEVEDGNREIPRRAGYGEQADTGRGLALVAALARSWGIEATPTGKVVWAELAEGRAAPQADPELDLNAIVAAWADEGVEPEFTVQLGEVSTSLLLEAKAHVDNLVRELTLASTGADSSTVGLPDHVAALVEGVVHRFAAARVAIKRQALDAAARGEPTTVLTLTLPLSAADAGEEYLAALDEADRYARASRLLTLATPPTHRIFRRWYVETLIDQLRARADGRPPAPMRPFQERLIEEFDAMAGVQATASRIARLQTVTAALAEATTVEEANRVLLIEGVQALGASGGSVFLVNEAGVVVPAAVGYSDELVMRLAAERPGDNLPATTAARTGRAVWIESPDDRNAVFPEMAGLEPDTAAICAVPLEVSGRVVGALRFSFDQAHLFDRDEREFIEALAAQATLALQRAELYAAERDARFEAEQATRALSETAERLRLLQKVTAELTAAHDSKAVADTVVTNATASIGADSAAVLLFEAEADELVRVAATGSDATLAGPLRVPLHLAVPATTAIRQQRIVAVADPAADRRRFPDMSGRYPEDQSLVVAPLVVGSHRLGVLRLGFHVDRNVDMATQLAFLAALADACAQALERAEASERAAETADRLAFLAEASAVLSESLEHHTTLAAVAELAVRRMGDGCVIELNGDEATLAVAHRDPSVAARARDAIGATPRAPGRASPGHLYRNLPTDLDGGDTRLRSLAEAMEATSAVEVALTGRSGTLGTMTLLSSGGRRYRAQDLAVIEDLARRLALAVETATAFEEQRGRLAAVTRVAEAAQRAILAPPPARLGSVGLAARYVSAAAEAQVGGDLYEVVQRAGSVRLLVGDVRGKGLDAVRKATVVLGEFRAAAGDGDLRRLAHQLDARITPYLDAEDFVTAVLADVADDGSVLVACCGHPPALLMRAGQLEEVGRPGSLPLGLGADPVVVGAHMEPGDRILLFTDGLLEARDPSGCFVEVHEVVPAERPGDVEQTLDAILGQLEARVGGDLGDDLALVLAEYLGAASTGVSGPTECS